MSHRERTIEQLDPMSAVNGWPITILGSLGVVLYAIVMTLFNRQDIDSPWLAVLAILGVMAAFSLLAVTASPLRPPVSRRVHAGGLALLLAAMALSAASMASSNAFVQDDWGPIVIGLFGLFICPYRPPRDLVAFAGVTAIFVAFIVLLQTPTLVTMVPPTVFIVIAVTPMLALSLAGATFAVVALKMTVRWRSRATSAVHALAAERLDGITRSVQQDRVTILNRDVVPFFSDVLARNEVTESDRVRAAGIASAIRSVMVHEVDRTWLEAVVGDTVGEHASGRAVADPERLASGMTTDQRTAVRALLVGLADQRTFLRDSLAVTLESGQARPSGELRAGFSPPDPAIRSLLAPYLAVIRVVFPASEVELSAAALTVRFQYDAR